MDSIDWKAFHTARGGVLTEGGLVLHYGDISAEVRALWDEAGLVFLEERGVLLVRGQEAEGFLHNLASNDIRGLKGQDGESVGSRGGKYREFQAQPNLFCNRYGKPLYEAEILRLDREQFLLLTEAGQLAGLAAHLESFKVRERVEIGQAPLLVLGVGGKKSEQVMQEWNLSATGGSDSLLVARSNLWQKPQPQPQSQPQSQSLPPRYWICLARSISEERLGTLLSSFSGQLAGRRAWEEVRIAAGRPLAGVDYTADNITAEAGLNTHISGSKGCYLGQEVHARLRYRGKHNKQLVAFWLEASAEEIEEIEEIGKTGETGITKPKIFELLRVGASLYQHGEPVSLSAHESQVAGEAVATITSMGSIPLRQRLFGIAMLKLNKLTPKQLISKQLTSKQLISGQLTTASPETLLVNFRLI